jgi:hypothetical protein
VFETFFSRLAALSSSAHRCIFPILLGRGPDIDPRGPATRGNLHIAWTAMLRPALPVPPAYFRPIIHAEVPSLFGARSTAT